MKKSVTMIELIIVIVTVAVVMLGLGGYVIKAVDTWNFLSFRSDIASEVRRGLMRIGHDIRSISQFQTATDSALCFNAVDSSGGKYICYRYASATGQVYYEENSANYGVMMQGLNGDLFDYYDTNMNNLTSPVNIGAIRYVIIKGNVTEGGQSMAVNYCVAPRNLQ